MPLHSLIDLLLSYQPFDGQEAAMREAMIQFIRLHADCLERSCPTGHITASAWVIDTSRQYALLTHHRKLDKWLQLGGHADGEAHLQQVALREVREESGLTQVRLLSEAIFDLDIHTIPATHTEGAHLHYDIRFLMEADKEHALCINHESKALAWVKTENIKALNNSESIGRMLFPFG